MEAPAPQPHVSTVRKLWSEALSLWQHGFGNLLARWWQVFLIVGIGMVLILADRAGWGWEEQLFQQIRQPDNQSLTGIARWLSKWGDGTWAVILGILFFTMGLVFGSPRWRQIAWACLFAVLASTILVNVFRPTLGRARPNASVPGTNAPLPGTFYGPQLKEKGIGFQAKFLAFPSGHASTAFAPAAALAAAAPVIGVPCLIFASSVGWSRMQLNQHRPLDVMTGAALGTFIGLCFGTAVPGAKLRMRGKKPGP
jgi:membrane-associated phospholipid phosphatase